ncbi:hypothetical protein FOYG_08501 [Fusarium oxysporum NRRL 32931]|uniref:Uncharacterized protein n=1 Tax=Fusarium oxysporum NRRL 32931 TaxID=660029 RepID=W9I9T1_FUSOX|nr:hypothetical protein FOYG_08501 [Fusarium oxysporum NRRL 32931]
MRSWLSTVRKLVFDRPVRLARDRGVSPVVGAGLSAWVR